jgi:hypothetical protein
MRQIFKEVLEGAEESLAALTPFDIGTKDGHHAQDTGDHEPRTP